MTHANEPEERSFFSQREFIGFTGLCRDAGLLWEAT